jgi:hypothetical protein
MQLVGGVLAPTPAFAGASSIDSILAPDAWPLGGPRGRGEPAGSTTARSTIVSGEADVVGGTPSVAQPAGDVTVVFGTPSGDEPPVSTAGVALDDGDALHRSADVAPSPESPASGGGPTADPGDLDELARRLYGRIRTQLRHELRMDRERSGRLVEARR